MANYSERRLIFLIGGVQFINILDFMIVMPLGPDFAHELDIPLSQLGMVGGSYTAAAAVSGLLGAFFLDRFPRRGALVLAMLGLVMGTALGGLAQNLTSLLAARLVAGAFGGPATSISLSIIADAVPAERRGKAMGAVMGAFSIASVLGVPAGLELSRWGGFRLPLFTVAGCGVVAIALAFAWLPKLPAPHPADRPALLLRRLVTRPTVLLSYSLTATVMTAGFILIPNLSPILLQNEHYPRAELGLLYLCGGAVSFFAMRAAGHLVDRWGSFRVGSTAALFYATVIYLGFAAPTRLLPVLVLFIAFMLAMAFRNVSYSTLTSKVPRPEERAGFMSLQSAVQHVASAAGAFTSSRILWEEPDGRLGGVAAIAYVSIALSLLLPLLFYALEQRVVRKMAPPAVLA